MQSAANAKALSGAAGFSGLLEIKTPNETKKPSFVAHGTDFIGAVKKAETVRISAETNGLKSKARTIEQKFEGNAGNARGHLWKLKGADEFITHAAAGRIHGDPILENFLTMKNDTRILQTFLREEILPAQNFKIEYGPDQKGHENGAEAAIKYYEQLEAPLLEYEKQFKNFAKLPTDEMQLECTLMLNSVRETVIARLCNLLLMQIGADGLLASGDEDDEEEEGGVNKNKGALKGKGKSEKRDWGGVGASHGTKGLIKCFLATRKAGEQIKMMERLLDRPENSTSYDAKRCERQLRDEITGLEEQLRQTKALLAMKGEHLENTTAKYEVLANEPGRLQNLSRQQDQISLLERNQMDLSREIGSLQERNRKLIQSESSLTDKMAHLHATLEHERGVFEKDVDSLRPEIQKQLAELRRGHRDMAYIRHGLSLTIDRFNLAEGKLAVSEARATKAETKLKIQNQELEMLRASHHTLSSEASSKIKIAMVAVAAKEREEAMTAKLREENQAFLAERSELQKTIDTYQSENDMLKRNVEKMAAQALKSSEEMARLTQVTHEMRGELAMKDIVVKDAVASEEKLVREYHELTEVEIIEGTETMMKTAYKKQSQELAEVREELENAQLVEKRLQHDLVVAQQRISDQRAALRKLDPEHYTSETELDSNGD